MYCSRKLVLCFQYVLNPTFTAEQITILETSSKLARAYDGTMYLPGNVGLNNIKANDYCNVILQVILLLKKNFVEKPDQRFFDSLDGLHGLGCRNCFTTGAKNGTRLCRNP